MFAEMKVATLRFQQSKELVLIKILKNGILRTTQLIGAIYFMLHTDEEVSTFARKHHKPVFIAEGLVLF
jgi:hypothetical protein